MASPGDITAELVQQILREAKKDDTIVVLPDLEVHEMNEELHLGSCLSRVTVKYTSQGDTSQHSLSFIVKVEPINTINADVVRKSTLFVREIQMFNEILPRMSILLSRALPDSHTDFSPRGYYTRKTPSYLIAIEDLSPKGFKAPKRKNGLDLEHCLLTMKTIARFHAASVMIRREDESQFAVFDKYSFQEEGFIEGLKMLTGVLVPVIGQIIESWPEFGRSWSDRVLQRCHKLQEDLYEVCNRDDNAFNVLNHGDFGLQNVMYRHSEINGELEAIMLVDFQCCSYNSPALDLNQYIFSSANNEVRANHIDTLLKEYHTELSATLEALGYPRDQIISLPNLHNEFNKKLVLGFFCTVGAFMFLTDLDSGSSPADIFNFMGDPEKLKAFIPESYLSNLRNLLPLFARNKVI